MAIKFEKNCIVPTDNAVGYDVEIGKFSSATAGVGNKISSSKTKIVDICADDGAANIGTADVRTLRSRLLLTTAQSGACSAAGLMGQLKNTAADTTTGHKCGVKGYLEAASGATVSNQSAGITGMIDVPSGATIANGATVAAISTASVDLGGTHTGKAVAINFEAPGTGNFDYLFQLPASAGLAVANTKLLKDQTDGCVAVLPVRFGTTNGWIPVLGAIPTV
jgi:hypothetical protein